MKSILRRELGSPLLLGLVGSLFIALGSLAVGWLGPGSNVRGWPIIQNVRGNDLLVHISTFVVIGAGLLLVIAWLKLGSAMRKSPADALKRVIVTSVVWALPLAFAVPLYSRDLFAYVGQGRLMAGGFNPYVDGISAIQGWFNIGVDPMWANAKTPYGPVYLWIEQITVMVAGTSPIMAVALFRLIAIVSALAIAYFAYRIAVLRQVDPGKVLWLVLASPVIMFNFVVAGHNDALMLALLIAGVYAALKRHPILGILLVTASVGVKPIAVLALPIIGIIWAGQNRTLRSTIKYWVVSVVLAVVVLGALGWLMNIGFGWVLTLATPGSVSHWYAPVNILAIAVGGAFGAFGLDGETPANIVKFTAIGLMVIVVAWVMLTKRNLDPLMRLALAFTATVVLSPVIHPWYAAWCIILFAIVGIREGLATHLVVSASIFFACVSIAEGMDISDSVQGDILGYVIRTVFITGGGIALIIAYCIHEELSVGLIVRRLREARERRTVAKLQRAAAGGAPGRAPKARTSA